MARADDNDGAICVFSVLYDFLLFDFTVFQVYDAPIFDIVVPDHSVLVIIEGMDFEPTQKCNSDLTILKGYQEIGDSPRFPIRFFWISFFQIVIGVSSS
jgi:hypothetical protein